MCLLDLDEIQEVMANHPLWSTRRWRPIQFRRSDFSGDPRVELKLAARQLVEDRLGPLPAGRVQLLTQLRTWGWCFNPISVYYCFDQAGRMSAAVASVTNTPWGERHDYVLEAEGGRIDQSVPKILHVSPFLAMDQTYHFALSAPRDRLSVGVDVRDGQQVRLATELRLTRRTLDRATMTALTASYPFMAWRVSAAIYWQAARLWSKRAPFYPHPRSVEVETQAGP